MLVVSDSRAKQRQLTDFQVTCTQYVNVSYMYRICFVHVLMVTKIQYRRMFSERSTLDY